MKEFYSIPTEIGLSSLINSKVSGNVIDLTELAVGDSDGAYYIPSPKQTKLVHEQYRTKINRIYQDPEYPTQLIIEAVIDETIGGFFIREVGIIDSDGNLFAIGRYPVTFKPISESGSFKDLYIRMGLRFSEVPNIKLFLNPHSALVSMDQLNNLALKDLSNVENQYKDHQTWDNLQGGTATERYHITKNQNSIVENFEDLKIVDNAGKCIVINEGGETFIVKEFPGGLPIFSIFSSLSAETPEGAYPLWTGEYIHNCQNIFPNFWNKAIDLHSKGLLRVISIDEYEAEIELYAETGGFVINEQTGDIRLPKVTRVISSIESLNQIGLPINDQLQGHWHNVNLRQDSYNTASPYDYMYGNDGITVGQSDTSSADERIWPIGVARSPGGAFEILTDNTYGTARIGAETRGKSIQLAQFIQVYNSAVPISIAKTAEFINAMSGKADIGLSNVPGAFYVVAEQRGKNGFIKYSDGRCEQWGLTLHAGVSWVTTPFYFDFANDEINLVLNAVTPANLTSGGPTVQLRYDVNKSRFIWHIPGGNSIWYCSWHAWGVWK